MSESTLHGGNGENEAGSPRRPAVPAASGQHGDRAPEQSAAAVRAAGERAAAQAGFGRLLMCLAEDPSEDLDDSHLLTWLLSVVVTVAYALWTGFLARVAFAEGSDAFDVGALVVASALYVTMLVVLLMLRPGRADYLWIGFYDEGVVSVATPRSRRLSGTRARTGPRGIPWRDVTSATYVRWMPQGRGTGRTYRSRLTLKVAPRGSVELGDNISEIETVGPHVVRLVASAEARRLADEVQAGGCVEIRRPVALRLEPGGLAQDGRLTPWSQIAGVVGHDDPTRNGNHLQVLGVQGDPILVASVNGIVESARLAPFLAMEILIKAA